MKITARFNDKKTISDKLYGIFFEDINFSVDGGVNLNQVANKNFSAVYTDYVRDKNYYYYQIFRALRKRMNRRQYPAYLKYWSLSGDGDGKVTDTDPVTEAVKNSLEVTVRGEFTAANSGFNGGDSTERRGRYLRRNSDRGAVGVKENESYTLGFYCKNEDFAGVINASVISDSGETLAEGEKIKVRGKEWTKIGCSVKAVKTGIGRLVIRFSGKGTLKCTEFFFGADDYWNKESGKYRFGRFRKDLIETLSELKPRFMRFPGGCITEGYSLENAYDWKGTVGDIIERRPKYDLWGEAQKDRVYMQSNEIGFYEYFLLAEDLKAEPLPILNAGLACQGRSTETVAPGDPGFEKIKDNVLDLIEFANGDPACGKWAALRAEMGHPAPFGLKIVGIGNENWGERYNENFTEIVKAVRSKYPDIAVVWSAGFHCYKHPSYDEHRALIDPAKINDLLVDDHFYRKPAWLIENEGLYDDYDRARYPIFLGEYAANTPTGKETLPNEFLSALAEAAFMTGLERNADIVKIASYAPLFSRVGGEQWKHNLINFNSLYVMKTANYHVQRLYSEFIGGEYIPVTIEDGEGVYVSLTEDKGAYYIKIVNTLAAEKACSIENITGLPEGYVLTAESLTERNSLDFYGAPHETISPVPMTADAGNIPLKPYSVNVYKIKK